MSRKIQRKIIGFCMIASYLLLLGTVASKVSGVPLLPSIIAAFVIAGAFLVVICGVEMLLP